MDNTDIFHLTLINGSELIAQSATELRKYNNVVKLYRGSNENGEYFIFQNFTPFQTDKDLEIADINVITKVLVESKELKDLYFEYLANYNINEFASDEEEIVGTIH